MLRQPNRHQRNTPAILSRKIDDDDATDDDVDNDGNGARGDEVDDDGDE